MRSAYDDVFRAAVICGSEASGMTIAYLGRIMRSMVVAMNDSMVDLAATSKVAATRINRGLLPYTWGDSPQ